MFFSRHVKFSGVPQLVLKILCCNLMQPDSDLDKTGEKVFKITYTVDKGSN